MERFGITKYFWLVKMCNAEERFFYEIAIFGCLSWQNEDLRVPFMRRMERKHCAEFFYRIKI